MVSVLVDMSESVSFATHPFMNIHCLLSKRKAFLIIEEKDSLEVVYEVLDEDREESFLTCEFAETIYPMLIIGTKNGILKVFNLKTYEFKYFLKGHGGAVNEIKVHPRKRHIIFSVSDDFTARMWDMNDKKTIAIFGGISGHRDIVLSLDVSICGSYLVTSSNDCTIKIWKIPKKVDGITCVYFPVFSSSEIHRSYIPCVRFYGKFIVSRGRRNRIVVFKPFLNHLLSDHKEESNLLFIDEYDLDKSGGLNHKFCVADNTLVVGSNIKKDEIYCCNLDILGENAEALLCKSNTNQITREIFIKGEFFYILYSNGLFERLYRRK